MNTDWQAAMDITGIYFRLSARVLASRLYQCPTVEDPRAFQIPSPAPLVPMKRDAAQYAVLSRLLDEVLDLDERARALWLEALPQVHAGERQVLHRLLTLDRTAANRRLKRLEAHLRSSVRAVRELSGR
jgi:hypothetical protein